MSRTAQERELTERLNGNIHRVHSDVMIEVERAACGCDYGGTSWTTKAQAERLVRLLRLERGKHLLEIGAGAGWPALYMARLSDCDLTLTDVPLNGLTIAVKRAAQDRLSGHCQATLASGAALPFAPGRFDAIGHSDVLCCLQSKSAVLEECRRVVKEDGRMVFTVIRTIPGLSSADHERAVASGPIFVDAPAPYPQMLREAGWKIGRQTDITQVFKRTLERKLREEKLRSDRLCELLGQEEFTDGLNKLSTTISAINDGLLKRTLFTVTPAPA